MSSSYLLGSNLPTNRSKVSLNASRKSNRSWFHRTFSRMEEGSLRGNILLLVITTMGSSFFLLPYCAKRVGIMTTIGMMAISALVSYYSSILLFHGFSNTSAKTYDECVEKILGQKMGIFANVVVLLHTLGQVMSTWIFAFKFITSGVFDITKSDESASWYDIYWFSFFGVTFLVIFLATLAKSIERLKVVSMIGLMILVYLIGVLVYLTPEYFEYYVSRKQIHFKNFVATWEILQVYGISQYIFLNQYSIMSICNNLKNVSFNRTTKLINRAIITLFLIYVFVLFCGYFSQPDEPTSEIFLLREPIEGMNDTPLLIGKIGFGFTLIVGIFVKCYYLLVFLEQLIQNSYRILTNENKRRRMIQKNIDFVQQHKDDIITLGDRKEIEKNVVGGMHVKEYEKQLEEDLLSSLKRT